MMTLEDLLKLPEELLEKAHAALVERRNNRHRAEEAAVAQRLKSAEAGHGDFKDDELTYAAGQRCACGAGMAYPEHVGAHGSWDCSAILKGQGDTTVTHSAAMPFMFYSVRSESQIARNNGYVTTRPSGTPTPAHIKDDFRRENERRRDHQPSSPQLVIPEVTP